MNSNLEIETQTQTETAPMSTEQSTQYFELFVPDEATDCAPDTFASGLSASMNLLYCSSDAHIKSETPQQSCSHFSKFCSME